MITFEFENFEILKLPKSKSNQKCFYYDLDTDKLEYKDVGYKNPHKDLVSLGGHPIVEVYYQLNTSSNAFVDSSFDKVTYIKTTHMQEKMLFLHAIDNHDKIITHGKMKLIKVKLKLLGTFRFTIYKPKKKDVLELIRLRQHHQKLCEIISNRLVN